MEGLVAELWANEPLLIMEAHNPLSACVASEAGAKAIWVSSLTVSATFGMRDRNELTASQMIEMTNAIHAASNVTIIVDGDNGHGDFNNARLFTKKLENAGASGVVFEDKKFPKQNSFWDTEHHLIDTSVFQGMIRASKDIQSHKNFWVIARTEALIAGRGIPEALDRAGAYVEAGADAIFIHSKKETGMKYSSSRKNGIGALH